MALKLWTQMNEHNKNGTCELTFGCVDPIQAGAMAKNQQVSELRSLIAIAQATSLTSCPDCLRIWSPLWLCAG